MSEEVNLEDQTDQPEGSIDFNGKEVGKREEKLNYFYKLYLDDFVKQVEKQIHQSGVRISRDYILGLLIEKLASYSIQGINSNNGIGRIQKALGTPDDIADEFLFTRRRFYSKEVTLSEGELARKKQEKEYVSALSTIEKSKYYTNKIKNYLIKKDLAGNFSVGNSSISLLLKGIFALHLMAFVFSIWHVYYYISTGIGGLYTIDYYVYKMQEAYFSYYGNFTEWLFYRYVIVGLYFLTILLFRIKQMKDENLSHSFSKWIRLMMWGHFLNVGSAIFYFIIGSLLTIYNVSPIHYPTGNVFNNGIILVIVYLTLFVLNRKFIKFDKIDYRANLDVGNTKRTIAEISRQIFNPLLQLALYVTNIVVGILALINVVSLISLINTIYIEYGFIYNISNLIFYNYSILLFISIFTIPYIIVGKLQVEDIYRLEIKNRIKRQLKIQIALMFIFNAYLLVVTYYLDNSVLYTSLSLTEYLAFGVYLIGSLILLLLNRSIRLDVPEMRKPGILSRYRGGNS